MKYVSSRSTGKCTYLSIYVTVPPWKETKTPREE
jgi:hypothetical protein